MNVRLFLQNIGIFWLGNSCGY